MSISTIKCNTVAVFDVDGTLIQNNIGVTLVKYLLKNKEVNFLPKIMILISYPLYKAGLLDFKYAILMGAWALAGKKIEIIDDLANACFERDIKQTIYQQGIAEIKKRKEEGCFVVLATGAHLSIASIFSKYVGADYVVATTSKVSNGKYTFEVNNPLPYRAGKRDLVFEYINKIHPNSTVAVYTDEEKDLPMLEHADVLIGVNADEIIANYVKQKGGMLVNFS
ncbi:MAG: hypothetical protein MSIBF_06165 [Candidatus Altiarchaeales archaeon IMC4]|nr:MAG: hypothetical protein MSIBF_06165 [Candidatus Altiarchaeales archaeon IMC4]